MVTEQKNSIDYAIFGHANQQTHNANDEMQANNKSAFLFIHKL